MEVIHRLRTMDSIINYWKERETPRKSGKIIHYIENCHQDIQWIIYLKFFYLSDNHFPVVPFQVSEQPEEDVLKAGAKKKTIKDLFHSSIKVITQICYGKIPYLFIQIFSIIQHWDMLFGNNKKMGWSLWIHIMKCNALIIFVKDVCRNFLVDYFAKYCGLWFVNLCCRGSSPGYLCAIFPTL